MKKILLFSAMLLGTVFSLKAQLYPKDYDDVDFKFDSIYSYNYQQFLASQDSLSLYSLKLQLDETIANAASTNELIITNSSIHSLPLGINNLTKLEKVVFANCKNLDLEIVLEQLENNKNLKSLEVSYSAQYNLPKNISKLGNLEFLSLKGNKIVRLPEELKDLSELKTIEVSNNSVLNEDLFFDLLSEMPQTDNIHAEYCNIRSLPPSTSKRSYESIYLKGNLLKTLPVGLNVKNLDISSNSYLDPSITFENLASNASLDKLNIGYNKWEQIPNSIGKLANLKELNLRGNRLNSLPEEIGNLSKLEVLKVDNPDKYLYTNQLISLPSSIGKLTELDSLFLSGNKLSSLPSNFEKLDLVYLDLSWNKLESFPKAVLSQTNLEYLNLAINHLMTLPAELTQLSSLKYLNLQGDFFVNYKLKIKTLPSDIGNLNALETLILSDNVIETLPESIGKCNALRVLDLKDNLFAGLPNNIGNLKNLEEMNLKANELVSLPTSFHQLSELRRLDLSFNFNLASDAAATQLGQLKNLQYLNIADSYFSESAVNQLMEALPTTSIITYVPKKEKKDE